MEIRVSADINRARKRLTRIQRKQLPFAIARALTQTAEFTATNLNNDTRQYFKSPTPFTQRAFRFARASKRRLISAVFAAPRQDEYLGYAVFGGTRQPKGRALLLPSGMRLNRYGNIPRRAVRRLLARPDTFSGTVRGIAGIWQRTSKRRLRLLVSYASRASYDPSFPFERLSRAYVARAFPVIFDRSLRSALRTAR